MSYIVNPQAIQNASKCKADVGCRIDIVVCRGKW